MYRLKISPFRCDNYEPHLIHVSPGSFLDPHSRPDYSQFGRFVQLTRV